MQIFPLFSFYFIIIIIIIYLPESYLFCYFWEWTLLWTVLTILKFLLTTAHCKKNKNTSLKIHFEFEIIKKKKKQQTNLRNPVAKTH